MLMLIGASDELRVTLSAAVTVDVLASYVDLSAALAPAPGRKLTAINSTTATAVAQAPGSGASRAVKHLNVRNKHASSSVDATVTLYDGSTSYELIKVTLAAGEGLEYDEGGGWRTRSVGGAIKHIGATSPITVSALSSVVLATDVTNANATANTIADVTGLSFSVTSGETYWFRFTIPYTSAATTTGSRWSINGPGSPTLLNYTSTYTLTATSNTVNSATAYDIPAASNATSLTAGNVAVIEGIITPSSNGTLIARFASEVSSSAIVAKAGSYGQMVRVL